MESLIFAQWEAKKADAIKTIADMQRDLNKYRERQDARENIIVQKERIITSLAAFIDYSDATFLDLVQRADDREKMAVTRTLERIKRIEEKPKETRHPEDIRAAQKLEAISKWPELFQSDYESNA